VWKVSFSPGTAHSYDKHHQNSPTWTREKQNSLKLAAKIERKLNENRAKIELQFFSLQCSRVGGFGGVC
jgi:hypothetical protein